MDKLCKINLNTASTTIETSAYMKDGGGQNTEWPWLAICRSNSHYDKWIMKYREGWVSEQKQSNFLT